MVQIKIPVATRAAYANCLKIINSFSILIEMCRRSVSLQLLFIFWIRFQSCDGLFPSVVGFEPKCFWCFEVCYLTKCPFLKLFFSLRGKILLLLFLSSFYDASKDFSFPRSVETLDKTHMLIFLIICFLIDSDMFETSGDSNVLEKKLDG